MKKEEIDRRIDTLVQHLVAPSMEREVGAARDLVPRTISAASTAGSVSWPTEPRQSPRHAWMPHHATRTPSSRWAGDELERRSRQTRDHATGSGPQAISAAITVKYPSRTTRAAVEAGDVWVFEAAPRK